MPKNYQARSRIASLRSLDTAILLAENGHTLFLKIDLVSRCHPRLSNSFSVTVNPIISPGKQATNQVPESLLLQSRLSGIRTLSFVIPMTAPDHRAPTIFTASNVYHQTLDNRRSYGLCPRNWQGEHVNAAYASGSYASHADVAHNYHFQVGDLMWTHFASGAEHLTPIEGFTVPCAPLARTTGVVDANLPLPPYWNPGYFPVQHYPDASITTADHELGASSTGSYSGIPPGEMPYNIPDAASLLHERPSLFQGDAVPQSQDSLPQGSLFEPVRSPEEPLRTNIAHSSEILTCHVDGCDKSFRERHRYK